MKTLQEVYDNSVSPEIITNNSGFKIRGFWDYPEEISQKKREERDKKLKRIYGKFY